MSRIMLWAVVSCAILWYKQTDCRTALLLFWTNSTEPLEVSLMSNAIIERGNKKPRAKASRKSISITPLEAVEQPNGNYILPNGKNQISFNTANAQYGSNFHKDHGTLQHARPWLRRSANKLRLASGVISEAARNNDHWINIFKLSDPRIPHILQPYNIDGCRFNSLYILNRASCGVNKNFLRGTKLAALRISANHAATPCL